MAKATAAVVAVAATVAAAADAAAASLRRSAACFTISFARVAGWAAAAVRGPAIAVTAVVSAIAAPCCGSPCFNGCCDPGTVFNGCGCGCGQTCGGCGGCGGGSCGGGYGNMPVMQGYMGLLELRRRHGAWHPDSPDSGPVWSCPGWYSDDDVQPCPLRRHAGRSGRRHDGFTGGDSGPVLVPHRLENRKSHWRLVRQCFCVHGSSTRPRRLGRQLGIAIQPAGTEKWPRRSE